MIREISIAQILKMFDGIKCLGDESIIINGLNLCNRDTECEAILTYVTNANYADAIVKNSKIKAVILKEEDLGYYCSVLNKEAYTFLISDEPECLFYNIHEYLFCNSDFYDKYEWESIIGEDCNIHESCIIENGVKIGNNVNIAANTVICAGTVIEDNVSIGCNNTIGNHGFQVIKFNNGYKTIHHVGGVLIKKNVTILDNCVVAKAVFEGKTFIGENTKIDCLNHIGHNVYIGNDVVITPQCVFLGSVTVLDGAWIGGGTSILNKVTIGENALIGIGSVVTRNIASNAKAYGNPAKTK